jgi:acetyl esterase
MPLDPQARAIIDLLASSDMPDLSIVEPEVIRKLTDAAVVPDQGEPVARVENRTLPGPAGEIPVRIYAPHTNGPLPVVAYFHGGGFVYCGLDTHDDTCRALANASGCSVVSVDYRLAPENKFPAAPEDAYAVTRWVALMARDRGGPALAFQLLVYPVADFGFDTDSYRENADGYLLTEKMMRAFWNHYLGDEADGDHPYASPLRAECLDALARRGRGLRRAPRGGGGAHDGAPLRRHDPRLLLDGARHRSGSRRCRRCRARPAVRSRKLIRARRGNRGTGTVRSRCCR